MSDTPDRTRGSEPPKPRKVDGREERGERTAEALLNAACQVFAERGYAGASVRRIAKVAEVNPALVRYHFGSKEGLYNRVIDRAMSGLRDRLIGAFLGDGTFMERSTGTINAYLDYLTEERYFPRVVARAILDGDPGLLRVARLYLKPLLESVQPFWRKMPANQLGTFDDVILTLFGAALVPVLYQPMLKEVYDADPLGFTAVERRRRHLAYLTNLLFEQLFPEMPD